MKDDIRRYARIGLVHHLLYPQCTEDPDDHVRTLKAFVRRPDIETFDCCIPFGQERRRELISAIRECGKQQIAYAAHLYPFRRLPPTCRLPHEQAQCRLIAKDMVEMTAAVGATGFVFASGGPPPQEAEQGHYAAFADFCRWLCGELKPRGITALLEPFDFTVDKKFLYGSTESCAALIRSLGPEVDNLGIELDCGHVPLMGETFAHAIRTVAPYLKRVHLGNCILRDASHPLYGDKHPPIGIEGGENDVPELAEILQLLVEMGFLNQADRGSMVIEISPWPHRSVEATVEDNMARLAKAWESVIVPVDAGSAHTPGRKRPNSTPQKR